MNIPTRLIAILPMLLLAAVLIATACEPAIPDYASQSNAIAAAAPTATATSTTTPTPEHTPTPTATGTETTLPQCRPGVYDSDSPEDQACRGRPNPVGCPQGRIPPPPVWMWDIEDGKVAVADCLPPPGPPPVYPNLAGSLSKVAEAYEQGASAQSAAMAASVDGELREGRLLLDITIDRDPKELVIWLNDNGAEFGLVNSTALVDDDWPARNGITIAEVGIVTLLSEYISSEAELALPYEGGETVIQASVPVSLLVRLSEQSGVVKVEVPFRLSAPQQTDVPPIPQEPQQTVTPTSTPQATS